jgi:hypothetical protein
VTKQRKRHSKPATLSSDADFLAEQMWALSTMMWTVAERMEYFAGFNPKLKHRAMHMAALSFSLRNWCSEVREQAATKKGGGK